MITIDGGTGKIIHNGVNVAPAIMVNTWRISSTEKHEGTNAVITSDWEENDTGGYGKMGSSLTNSSGVFSFPQTGMYYILSHWRFLIGTASDAAANVSLEITTNGTDYSYANIITVGDGAGGCHDHLSHQHVANITDTTNKKVQFASASMTNATLKGGTSQVYGQCVFLRLADN